MSKYNDSTKKVLEQQLGSVLSTKKPEETTYPSNGCYYPHLEAYEYNGYNTYNDGLDDTREAEYLIQSMEEDPSRIYQVASTASISTLEEILRLLLLR